MENSLDIVNGVLKLKVECWILFTIYSIGIEYHIETVVLKEKITHIGSKSISLVSPTTTDLYYISGDKALIQTQSKKCLQKHGRFCQKGILILQQTLQ